MKEPSFFRRQMTPTSLGNNGIEPAGGRQVLQGLYDACAEDPLALKLLQIGERLGDCFLVSHIIVAASPLVAIGFELLTGDEDLRQFLHPWPGAGKLFRIVVVE